MENEIITFKQNKHSNYKIYDSKYHNVSILALWLDEFTPNMLTNLLHGNTDTICGNLIRVEIENGTACIDFEFEDSYDNALIITKHTLDTIIKLWLNYIKTKPNRIELHQNKEKVLFSAHFDNKTEILEIDIKKN